MRFKGYDIYFEKHHWGWEVAAIPDSGETIRRKFIGYTKAEMTRQIKDQIKGVKNA